MENCRFQISNNIMHNKGIDVVAEQLKPFFRKGAADFKFTKITARTIPGKSLKTRSNPYYSETSENFREQVFRKSLFPLNITDGL